MVAIAKHLASAHKMSLLQREHFKATHDPVTGLINQVTLDERIEREISIGARYQKSFALLILEVDCLKATEETGSRVFADKLLIDFANRLQGCVRSTDTVARYDDNLFVVLLPDISNVRNVVKVIQSINVDLLSPFSVDDRQLVINPTIGVSVYPTDGESQQRLLEQAHIAMCQARNDHLKNYRYYSTDIDTEISRQISLEEKIRKAIDSHEYDIHYQPVHALSGNVTMFVDSVVHWSDSELCSLKKQSVNKIIEFLELGKLFTDITLNEIARQISVWEAGRSSTTIPVLFEVTPEQFAERDLAARFKQILKNQSVSASSIMLVIDEKSILENTAFAIEQIREFKQEGFRIVIDRFASGLSYIGKLSHELIDIIRIDSQMIDELDNCMEWLGVVGGIVKIAENMQVDAIICGINNVYQFRTLQTISAAYWQGDYSYLMANTDGRNLS